MNKIIRDTMINMIKLYQRLIVPFIPPCCRFYPSCSTYAILSLEKYGLMKGLFLSVYRILKCNPFHPGGLDPVE